MGGYQDPSQNQSPGTIGVVQAPMQQPGQLWGTPQSVPALPGGPTPMDTTPAPTTDNLAGGASVVAAAGTGTGVMVGALDETNVKSAQKLSEKMRKDESEFVIPVFLPPTTTTTTTTPVPRLERIEVFCKTHCSTNVRFLLALQCWAIWRRFRRCCTAT